MAPRIVIVGGASLQWVPKLFLDIVNTRSLEAAEIVLQDPFERRIPATNVPDKTGDLIRASIGGKFTVRGGTVLVVNGLFPLREVGLQPDFIWTLGVDFPF